MGVRKLVHTPEEAYGNIRTRLLQDVEPVWDLINHKEYSPFWLLVRELFPVAESLGDLFYNESPTRNLQQFLEHHLATVRPDYKDKGALIAQLYRHSLTHQDEPRSLYCGGITIHWHVAIFDGSQHLRNIGKLPKRRTCIMAFDLRAFYEDLLVLLARYEQSGPRKSIVKRYNNWTYEKIDKEDRRTLRAYTQARKFYFEEPEITK